MKNIKFFISLFTLVGLFLSCSTTNNSKITSSKEEFNAGIEHFNKNELTAAQGHFKKVNTFENNENLDSIYSLSQIYIALCENSREVSLNDNYKQYVSVDLQRLIDEYNKGKQKQKEDETKNEVKRKKENANNEKIKDNLRKKYERIFCKSGWIFEKEEKLASLNFIKYKSGFEDCPSGGREIAMYYKKIESGYTVQVRLQYSYGNRHYAEVWIE